MSVVTPFRGFEENLFKRFFVENLFKRFREDHEKVYYKTFWWSSLNLLRFRERFTRKPFDGLL
jgi:hypothetical protein